MAVENDILNDAISDEELTAAQDKPTPRPRTTRARVPAPKGDVQVATTLKYTASPDEVNYEERNQTPNGANPFQTNDHESPFKNTYSQTNQGFAPTNRLADMFAELAEYGYDGQQFNCFLIRKPDFANDKFRRRALAPENFAPFPITVQSVLDFISTVQSINGDSGGRFDVRVSDENGIDTEIGIAGLVVADPIIKETPNNNGNPSNDLTTILKIMQEERQRTDEKFALILAKMSEPPKESELERALRQKMINDLVNPPTQANAFNADEFITKVFTSQAILETVSNRFAEGFGSKDKKESTLELLLGNEMLVNAAKDTVSKVVTAAENVIAATQQRNAPPQQNPQYQPQPNNDGYPPLNAPPQPPTPTPEEIAQAEKERKESIDMLNQIIAELESDNPITRENEVFVKITAEHPKVFKELETACKVVPFDTILDYLEQASPETFEPFYGEPDADGAAEFNERGEKIEKRLRELYDLLRG